MSGIAALKAKLAAQGAGDSIPGMKGGAAGGRAAVARKKAKGAGSGKSRTDAYTDAALRKPKRPRHKRKRSSRISKAALLAMDTAAKSESVAGGSTRKKKKTDNPVTAEWEAAASELYEDGEKREFQRVLSEMLMAHPLWFKCLDLANEDDAVDNRLEVATLHKHFGGKLKPAIVDYMFAEILLGDRQSAADSMTTDAATASVSYLSFHKWTQSSVTKAKKRRPLGGVSKKDAKWLYDKLRTLDLRELDDDENFQVELDEMQQWASKFEVQPWVVEAVFDVIDDDGNGHITPMEFFKWRNNCDLEQFQKLVRAKTESTLLLKGLDIEPFAAGTLVSLTDAREGQIKDVRVNEEDANDVTYGVRLAVDGSGDSDGTDASTGKRLFECPKDSAVFVKHEFVRATIEHYAVDFDFMAEPYSIGQSVELTTARLKAKAQVKWVGTAASGKPTYGLRLATVSSDENQPNGDGLFEDERRFQCPKGFALFLAATEIKKVIADGGFDFTAEPYAVGDKVKVRMDAGQLLEAEEKSALDKRSKMDDLRVEIEEKIQEATDAENESNRKMYKLTQDANDLEARLTAAKKAVKKSRNLISKIEKRHWDELKAYKKPPAKVRMTLEAVCLLVGPSTVGVKSIEDWSQVRRAVAKPGFVKKVLAHKAKEVSDATLKEVASKYAGRKEFSYKAIKASSKACGPLAMWVLSQVENDELLRNESELLKQVAALRSEMHAMEAKAAEAHAVVGQLRDEWHELEVGAKHAEARFEEVRSQSLASARTVDGQIKYVEEVGEESELREPVLGIRMRECVGDSDGTEAKTGAVRFEAPKDFAVFVTAVEVMGSAKDQAFDYMHEPYAVGDKVQMADGSKGQVKFVGKSQVTGLPIVGIRLQQECDGSKAAGFLLVSDGTFEGERRFQCPPKHALFVDDCGLIAKRLDSGEAAFDYSNEPYTVGDKVQLADGNVGQVKFVSDTVIGIRVVNACDEEKADGSEERIAEVSDGTLGGERKFECPPKHGLFLADSGFIVERLTDDDADWDYSHEPYHVGDCVALSDGRLGQIKFIGPLQSDGEPMYGIRVAEPFKGDCDGHVESVKGIVAPFECPKEKGTYVRIEDIRKRLDSDEAAFDYSNEPYTVGDKVKLADGNLGQVKFVSDAVIGIRVLNACDEEKADGSEERIAELSDGTLDGERKFECPPKHALFLADAGLIVERLTDDEADFDFSAEPYKIGDKVQLTDGRKGQIKWKSDSGVVVSGDTADGSEHDKAKVLKDSEDVVYGIRFAKASRKAEDLQTDGTLTALRSANGVEEKHFECHPHCGGYVELKDIECLVDDDWDYSHEPYHVGDCVALSDGRVGQIKFIGPLQSDGEPMYGIRFAEPHIGDCDGHVESDEGVICPFHCPKEKGEYVSIEDIGKRLGADEADFDFMEEDLAPKPRRFVIGERVWVTSPSGKVRECEVSAVGQSDARQPEAGFPNTLKIHYVSYNARFDEWLSADDCRILTEAPQTELRVDDACSVYHFGLQQWVVSEVEEVSAEMGLKFRYVSTETAEWLSPASDRISREIKEPHEEFTGQKPDGDVKYVKAKVVYKLSGRS